MTAELSSMMDENGGYVVWYGVSLFALSIIDFLRVQRAFGPFAGWVNSHLFFFPLLEHF
jgi:hypothetical protein